MPERRLVEQGRDRRAWAGAGAELPDEARAVLALAKGRRACRWEGLGRRAARGVDQVEAERMVWAGVEAGLAIVRERRDRRGDWQPFEWRLTDAGEALFEERLEVVDLEAWLAGEDPPNHPLLRSIRAWLVNGGGTLAATRLAIAIGDELRAGRVPRDRMLSVRLAGHSKAIRAEDCRDELEAALGLPLEHVVRRAARAALIAGPLRFRVGGIEIDAGGLPPWLALPPETIERMTDLRVDARRLWTVENLYPFEEEARRGPPPGTVLLYLGGFPGELERALMERLVAAGVTSVDHWGDLDVGGLRILRHLQELLPVPVRAIRMDAALLAGLPSQPLSDGEREDLAELVAVGGDVGRLAAELLSSGRKVEQEAWYLRG